jgi:hypothetical protein
MGEIEDHGLFGSISAVPDSGHDDSDDDGADCNFRRESILARSLDSLIFVSRKQKEKRGNTSVGNGDFEFLTRTKVQYTRRAVF